MTAYVQVAVNVPQVSGVFDYHIPQALEGRLVAGSLVVVPFGSQVVQGVVLSCASQPSVAETRPVQDLLDPLPVVTPAQIELAKWLSEQNLAPLAACLELMLPPGLSQHAEWVLSPLEPEGAEKIEASLLNEDRVGNAMAVRLLALVRRRGELRAGQLDAAFPRQAWRPAVPRLARRGLVQTSNRLQPPAVRPKVIRTAQLAQSPAEMEAQLSALGRNADVASRRQAILRFLMSEAVPVEIPWVLANSGGKPEDLTRLAEMGLIILGETEVWRDPLENMEVYPDAIPNLAPQQQQAWKVIQAALQSSPNPDRPHLPLLLHGVTGSGKTELYLRAVAETLASGRQAIILVPEISLTPQTLRRFMGRFPGQVGLMHSRLSAGERYDTWRRARGGLLPVILGPRSALFAPLPKLGLVVVDECHDEAYYQGDHPPYYHAVSAAVAYARLAGAIVLLGSATPDVTQTYQAEQGRWQRLILPERLQTRRPASDPLASAAPSLQEAPGEAVIQGLPQVTVVDMRQELQAGNRSIFSLKLQAGLRRVLEAEQQAILFLNRRGTATYVFCRDCGYALRCPRCDRPLIYHEPRSGLICHTCGYQRQLPDKCPHCGSRQIRQFGTGTEKVEREVQALFPQARTLRWDAETTRQKDAHSLIMSHFVAHRADILVGTQMLAKGLDLPLVTLVGVVMADVGLNLPDYRAAERVFQVLTQVAGRAGRSDLGGEAIFQTYQPEAYPIQAASRQDYAAFYTRELAYRRELGYPPFYHLARLEYRHAHEEQARAAAERLAELLLARIRDEERGSTELIGPAPCFFSRQEGYYRWQIIIRSPNPASLLRRGVPDGWRVEIDPPSLL